MLYDKLFLYQEEWCRIHLYNPEFHVVTPKRRYLDLTMRIDLLVLF